MQVIDGLQRISTICSFFEEEGWIMAESDDIDKRISGVSVKEIKTKSPQIFQDIQNVTLPVTLLRCDHSNPKHSEYIFTIFRRLNTGGMKLTNQEIRNAVYAGKFNELLQSLNSDSLWAALLKKTTGQKNADDRFRSIELVLKVFAFYDNLAEYHGKLNVFLNEYMQRLRDLSVSEIETKKSLFEKSFQVLDAGLFPRKSATRLSGVAFETVFYGVSKNLKFLTSLEPKPLRDFMKGAYSSLMSDDVFSPKNLREGIYKKQKVLDRMTVSARAFSGQKK
jgi:hypothetical protein